MTHAIVREVGDGAAVSDDHSSGAYAVAAYPHAAAVMPLATLSMGRRYRSPLAWFVFEANLPERQARFQSGWFIEGLLSPTLIVHMMHTRKIPFIQSAAGLPVALLTATIMAIGICVLFSPLGTAVGLVPLPMSYFP